MANDKSEVVSWLTNIDPNTLLSWAKENPMWTAIIAIFCVGAWYFKSQKEDKNIEINQKAEGNSGNVIQVGRDYDKSKRK